MTEKGKIISGYQGIGKTSLGGFRNVVDLKSECFCINGKRSKTWYKAYINIATNLCNQGFVVFVSSHKEVRDWMNKNDIEFTVICPSLELKEEWLKRLLERYENNKSEKNKRAYLNAKEHYVESIRDLLLEKKVLTIKKMDYKLYDLAVYGVENLRKDVFGFLDNLVINV